MAPGLRLAAGAGALGGLASLAKAFSLPAFLAGAFAVTAVVALLAEDGVPTRRRLVAGAVAAATCVLVALPWAAVLSIDRGSPTIGASGSYNVALVAPGSQGTRLRQPGLVPPAHEHAVSAFEEPSRQPTASWSDATLDEALRRVADNIVENARRGSPLVRSFAPMELCSASRGSQSGCAPNGRSARGSSRRPRR